MRFKRPCLDCNALTDNGDRCPAHALAARNRYYAQRGPSPYADPAWRRLSALKRKQVPYCERCGTTSGTLTVDHIVPLSKGGALLVPLHELRVLCRPCHGAITTHARTR